MNSKDTELIFEAYTSKITESNIEILNGVLDVLEEGLLEEGILDVIQTGLDIAGVEPTIGTGADAVNSVISLLRAAAAKEPDQRKKHLINAAISGVSMVPFADVAKALKARKFIGKPLAKGALAVGRAVKGSKSLRGNLAKAGLKMAISDKLSNPERNMPGAAYSESVQEMQDAIRSGLARLF